MFVIIFSNASDAHVPLVTHKLEKKGIPHRLLCTDQFGTAITASCFIDASDAQTILHFSDGLALDLKDVTAVWYRRPEVPVLSDSSMETLARQFAEHELKSLLSAVQMLASTGRWLSRPEAIRSAGNKLQQLQRARLLGFSIPPTLCSQDPSEIRAFRRACGKQLAAKIISKGPPRTASYQDQYVVYTTLLEDEELWEPRVLSVSPVIYQPYIDKAFELRVTVVGTDIFACRIDSQSSEKARVDWRNYDFEHTPHSSFDLDDGITKLCRDLVRSYGLAFGAIDLIVTPDGETVFLELNPNGQWGWIEELTGLPIAAAHVNFLCGA